MKSVSSDCLPGCLFDLLEAVENAGAGGAVLDVRQFVLAHLLGSQAQKAGNALRADALVGEVPDVLRQRNREELAHERNGELNS